jgi:hypothetical protein
MKKFLLISLLSNITLFANKIPNQQSILPPLIWLTATFSLIGILFWSFYKALESKNPKYGYIIALIIILIGGLLFI